MHVDNAIRSRKSVRRFLPLSISKPVIEHILQVASRAPSGNNLQPWHVHVLTGDAKQALCADLLASAAREGEGHDPEYQYYPSNWFEPYQSRRRASGFGLYEALGIDRNDLQARERQNLRNLHFFDAPIGLLISLDRRLNTGSYIDVGMFIQNIMLAARRSPLAAKDYTPAHRQHSPGITPSSVAMCRSRTKIFWCAASHWGMKTAMLRKTACRHTANRWPRLPLFRVSTRVTRTNRWCEVVLLTIKKHMDTVF